MSRRRRRLTCLIVASNSPLPVANASVTARAATLGLVPFSTGEARGLATVPATRGQYAKFVTSGFGTK